MSGLRRVFPGVASRPQSPLPLSVSARGSLRTRRNHRGVLFAGRWPVSGDQRRIRVAAALLRSAPLRLAASELAPRPLTAEAVAVKDHRHTHPNQPPKPAFAGFRFPPEVILIAVRWYLRYGLSYRDLEEPLAEGGIEAVHVTLFRWVQRFTPFLIDAARPCRHSVGSHGFVDETYVKVSGPWRYVYRAADQCGQVIDVFVSKRRDLKAATKFFADAIGTHGEPAETTTDRAHALVRVVTDLLPAALRDTTQYADNRIEADHGRLKARLRPMRGLKRDRTASVVVRGRHSSRTCGAATANSGCMHDPV